MLKLGSTAATATTTIPPALSHDAAVLRRDLAAAVDVLVPLLARISPLGERVCDVAETLDGISDDMTMASNETWSEVSRQTGLDELDRTVQRLLAAIPRTASDDAGVGELQVTRSAA